MGSKNNSLSISQDMTFDWNDLWKLPLTIVVLLVFIALIGWCSSWCVNAFFDLYEGIEKYWKKKISERFNNGVKIANSSNSFNSWVIPKHNFTQDSHCKQCDRDHLQLDFAKKVHPKLKPSKKKKDHVKLDLSKIDHVMQNPFKKDLLKRGDHVKKDLFKREFVKKTLKAVLSQITAKLPPITKEEKITRKNQKY